MDAGGQRLLIRGFGVQVPGGAPVLTCADALLGVGADLAWGRTEAIMGPAELLWRPAGLFWRPAGSQSGRPRSPGSVQPGLAHLGAQAACLQLASCAADIGSGCPSHRACESALAYETVSSARRGCGGAGVRSAVPRAPAT